MFGHKSSWTETLDESRARARNDLRTFVSRRKTRERSRSGTDEKLSTPVSAANKATFGAAFRSANLWDPIRHWFAEFGDF